MRRELTCQGLGEAATWSLLTRAGSRTVEHRNRRRTRSLAPGRARDTATRPRTASTAVDFAQLCARRADGHSTAHDATRKVFNQWQAGLDSSFKIAPSGSSGQGAVNWKKIAEEDPEMLRVLTEKMLDAAQIPQNVRDEYYRQFNVYKERAAFKAEYQKYIEEANQWQIDHGPELKQYEPPAEK